MTDSLRLKSFSNLFNISGLMNFSFSFKLIKHVFIIMGTRSFELFENDDQFRLTQTDASQLQFKLLNLIFLDTPFRVELVGHCFLGYRPLV